MTDAQDLERCIAAGGVAVFPADTVYGLACDPENRTAVEHMYALKHRQPGKPSAVMFFELDVALDALPELGELTRRAMEELLPGGVSLLLPNPARRFPLACGDDPSTLGLRVPDVPRLRGMRRPVLQSSANHAGGADPCRLEDVPMEIRDAADLVIDGGELPGRASTVIDFRRYQEDGSWSVVREGIVGEVELQRALGGQFHFDPDTYDAEIRAEVPDYDRLQRELADASGRDARRILELGTGSGATAARLLARHREAILVGIDVSDAMLATARERLPSERVRLLARRIEDTLPDGPYDLVVSALAVHHLDPADKAQLFGRIRAVLAPGGRFVLADVMVPDDPADARIPLTPGFDKPDSVAAQLRWLADAGFDATVTWERADLAVIVASATPADIVAAT